MVSHSLHSADSPYSNIVYYNNITIIYTLYK